MNLPNFGAGLDSPKAAGVITIAAVLVLGLLRRGFGGVNIGLGS